MPFDSKWNRRKGVSAAIAQIRLTGHLAGVHIPQTQRQRDHRSSMTEQGHMVVRERRR